MFIIFLIIPFIFCNEIINGTYRISSEDTGFKIIELENNMIYVIKNPNNFNLEDGLANVSLNVNRNDYSVEIKSYKYIPEIYSKSSKYFPFEIYNAKFVWVRCSHKDNKTCPSFDRMKKYAKEVDAALRLWSGNRITMDWDAMYITPGCVHNLDHSLSHPAFMNDVWKKAKVEYPDLPTSGYNTRVFFTDIFNDRFNGIAANTGSFKAWSNRLLNHVVVMKQPSPNIEDASNTRATTLCHETHHNLGFSHANTVSGVGFLKLCPNTNAYGDEANIMGRYAHWYAPPGPMQVLSCGYSSRGEPYMYRDIEEGKHTYRLMAWDHPFSRYFLGVENPNYEEDDEINGIKFRYHALTIKIPFTPETMSSQLECASSGVYLEFRWWNRLQKGIGHRGLRFAYAETTGVTKSRSQLIDAQIDPVKAFAAGELPIGYTWSPSDVDNGYLSLRIDKIHWSSKLDPVHEDTYDSKKRDVNEPAWMEVEIDYNPGKKRNRPTNQPPFPSYTFSPSIGSCSSDEKASTITCTTSKLDSFWFYMNDNTRKNNNPRVYSNAGDVIKTTKGFRSYQGYSYRNVKQFYGDNEYVQRGIIFNFENKYDITYKYEGVNKGKLYKEINGEYVLQSEGTIIYAVGLDLSDNKKVYVKDLFGVKYDVKVEGNGFVLTLPPLETDGITECYIIIEDSKGSVVSVAGKMIYNPYSGDYVALEHVEGKKYVMTSSVIKSGYYTHSSMLSITTINKDTWFIYPMQYMDIKGYILIDFVELPSGLKMTIETENKDVTIDLSSLGGGKKISYKLTCLQLNYQSYGNCEIYRIKFNKKVTLRNIRGFYTEKASAQLAAVSQSSQKITLDQSKYRIDWEKQENSWSFKEFSRDVYSDKYNVKSDTQITLKVYPPVERFFMDYLWIFIVVGVVLILIIVLTCYCKCKKKAANRAYPNKAYPNRAPYPGSTLPTMQPGYQPGGNPQPRGYPQPQSALQNNYAGGYKV